MTMVWRHEVGEEHDDAKGWGGHVPFWGCERHG